MTPSSVLDIDDPLTADLTGLPTERLEAAICQLAPLVALLYASGENALGIVQIIDLSIGIATIGVYLVGATIACRFDAVGRVLPRALTVWLASTVVLILAGSVTGWQACVLVWTAFAVLIAWCDRAGGTRAVSPQPALSR